MFQPNKNFTNLKDLFQYKYNAKSRMQQSSISNARASSRQQQSNSYSRSTSRNNSHHTRYKVGQEVKAMHNVVRFQNENQNQQNESAIHNRQQESNNHSQFMPNRKLFYQYLNASGDECNISQNKSDQWRKIQSSQKRKVQNSNNFLVFSQFPRSRQASRESKHNSSQSFSQEKKNNPQITNRSQLQNSFQKSPENKQRKFFNQEPANLSDNESRLRKKQEHQFQQMKQQHLSQIENQQILIQKLLNYQQALQDDKYKANSELMKLIRKQGDEYDNKDEDQDLILDDYPGIQRSDFKVHFVIGKGGFGKVWKVEMKKNRDFYAMKQMSKAKIIAKRNVTSIMNEKQLLTELKAPFLVNMYYAFQDRENVYLIMDLLKGGDLRYHIGKMRRFKEHHTKFFVACMVIALEFVHNLKIIHRDVKPENLVFDELGYVRLTDFGIARRVREENASDTSGTPGYMGIQGTPEVMCRQNHGIAVDYFAVGVIAYEFMLGKRPYQGRSRKEIRDQILAKYAQIRQEEVPQGWSLEAVDFINKMIQRKPGNRLGFNGPNEVKAHPWLASVPWDELKKKKLTAPYIPTVSKRIHFIIISLVDR